MVIGKTIASFGVMAAVGGFVASNLTAWRLGHQAALGPPLAHYHDWPLYAPWDILAWAPWQGTVPAIHAGLIVAAGITALPLLPLAKRFTRPSFGQKEWGSRRDARRAGLLSRDPRGGIVLGMLGREIMTFSGDQHTLVAGASGSGKTAGPVLTTLLSCRDRSMLVFDPKGELYRMSAPFRSSVGAAFFFDPTEPDSACFNPLAEIPVGTSREIAAVQNIASILVDSSGLKNSEPIWPITATDLLTAIILYAVTGIPAPQRHLGTLRELMFEMPTTLEKMARGKNDECQRVGATMLAMTPKTADAIALTARSALSVFADPLVVEKTSRSDFRISDLVCSRYPMSLYLQVPPSDRDRVMPLFRLMLVQIFKAFLYRTDVMADGRKKRHRLQLVADEFPAVGKIPGFAQDIQEFRGYGISCMLLCQSLKSLAALYGNSQVIRDNCHIVTCFASSDTDSMADISKAVGQGVEIKTSTTTHKGRWFGGSESKSESRRPLLEPGDVRTLGMDEAIVLVTGTRPLRARKIRWFAHRKFRDRGIDLRRFPDTGLVQNEEILAMHEAAEPASRPIQIAAGWTNKKTAAVLFPDEAESARKWVAGDRPLPAKHRAFVDHLLTTIAAIPDEQRERFLTPATVERLRQGEVIS